MKQEEGLYWALLVVCGAVIPQDKIVILGENGNQRFKKINS